VRARRRTVECWRPKRCRPPCSPSPTRVVSLRCPIAAEEAKALLGSLMALGTDHGSVLKLDQLLLAVACQLGYQLQGRAAIE
jgi:hypothetical protein